MKKFIVVLLIILVPIGLFAARYFVKHGKTGLQKDPTYYDMFPFGTFNGNSEDISTIKEVIISHNAWFSYLYKQYEYKPGILSEYFDCSNECKESMENVDKTELYFLKKFGLWNGKDEKICISMLNEEERLLERKNLESAATYLEKCIEKNPEKVNKIIEINCKAAPLSDFMELSPEIIFKSMPVALKDEETKEILDDLFLVNPYVNVYRTTPDKLKNDLESLRQTIEKSKLAAKSLSYYEKEGRKYINEDCIGIRIKNNKAYVTILSDIVLGTKFFELKYSNGKWKICRTFILADLSGKGRGILFDKAMKYIRKHPFDDSQR